MKTKVSTATMMATALLATCLKTKAQTVADFENLTLSPNSYWNGSSQPLGSGFQSGNAYFPNYYDTSWGGYWSEGWAYSNIKDSVTPGYANMYASRAGSGYNQSAIYAIGKHNAKIVLTGNSAGKVINGLYVTNSTYAYYSMRDGDMFARKFGDTTGTNCGCPQGSYPDWFKLTIRKYYGGILTNDSVEFYLADYRFSNNQQDYIIKDWTWVDLSSLGNVDSLLFTLSSSDVGPWGMNTPAFFCVDNIITLNAGVGLQEASHSSPAVYPSFTEHTLYVSVPSPSANTSLQLYTLSGQKVFAYPIQQTTEKIEITPLPAGIYIAEVRYEEVSHIFKIFKR